MSKYEPITVHLAALSHEHETHRMRFEEIDALLGRPLPPTARDDRTWWANTKKSNHARSWLSVGWKISSVDANHGTVTFCRQNVSPLRTRTGGDSHRHLRAFFHKLPAEQQQLALSFDEFAAVMHRPLPRTALIERSWWANTSEYDPGKTWLAAGWRVEAVYMRAQMLVFRRKGTAVLDMIRHCVKRLIEPDSAAAKPDARTVALWLRHCRRVYWYFEGTILYERSGVSFDGLDDNERSELEEDYDVCKRELNRYRQDFASL